MGAFSPATSPRAGDAPGVRWTDKFDWEALARKTDKLSSSLDEDDPTFSIVDDMARGLPIGPAGCCRRSDGFFLTLFLPRPFALDDDSDSPSDSELDQPALPRN